jgi:hypothetical protein
MSGRRPTRHDSKFSRQNTNYLQGRGARQPTTLQTCGPVLATQGELARATASKTGGRLSPTVIARSVSDEAIQVDPAVLDCFAFGSQ